jgi:pimeloyl-[acyl-carrier protein] methyl ester esterase
MTSLAIHTNGDGPNLTLVHGWGLGSAVLTNLALELGEHFTVNRVDLPGYGDSPALETADFDAVVDALAATLPPRAMLCGWSLGALVCVACAARYPRLVARMVLVGATASFVAREGWPEAMPVAELDEFRHSLTSNSARLLKRFAKLIHHGAAKSVTQPHEAEHFMRTGDGQPANDATLLSSLELLAQTDLREQLRDVHQPVLLVHGDADPLMPLAAAERLMMLLPEARLEVFGGSAHVPFATDPARFVASVCRFAGITE